MKKKLGIFITLGVVLALAIAVLVLYLIPVNYMPKLNNPDQIRIYVSSSQGLYKANDPNDKPTYDDLLDKYNKAFSQSLLASIFAGQSTTTVQGNGKLDPVDKPSSDMEFVLHFNEGQKLVVAGVEQSPISDVYVQVTDSSGYTKSDVYFKQATGTKYYKFTTYVNQKILYDAINNLDWVK